MAIHVYIHDARRKFDSQFGSVKSMREAMAKLEKERKHKSAAALKRSQEQMHPNNPNKTAKSWSELI
jgi:hypothetical protein